MRVYRRLCVLGLVGFLVWAYGCAKTATVTQQAASTSTKPAERDECLRVGEIEFLDCMVRRPKCTFAHAVKAVTILMAAPQTARTFDQQYHFLLDHKVVRPAWKIERDQWIDRGTVSYMLYRAMGLRGGVNMTMFASWGLGERRYAYRELMYRKLAEPGTDYMYVSGPELVTMLGRVDDYMQKTGRYGQEDEVKLGEKGRQ